MNGNFRPFLNMEVLKKGKKSYGSVLNSKWIVEKLVNKPHSFQYVRGK
jgi:hypothetical protein